MQKAAIILVLCFALLLGIVLMDPQLTGFSFKEIGAAELYQGNSLVIAFSVLVLIFAFVGLTYHQLYKHLN